MKVLKKILIGFGVVFCLLLVLAGGLLYTGVGFKADHEAFVREFMADYSRSWDVQDVHDRLAAEYLEGIQRPDGEQAVAFFRRLGAVVEITDLSLENIFAGTEGKTGVFVFKAQFDAAHAVVRLTVRESDGAARVLHLHVTPVGELTPLPPAPAKI